MVYNPRQNPRQVAFAAETLAIQRGVTFRVSVLLLRIRTISGNALYS